MVYRKTFPDKPEKTYQRVPIEGPSCKFNEGVSCETHDKRGRRIQQNCERCGWNPEVASQRKHDNMVKLGMIRSEK
jgi:hypothetical protein